MPHSNCAAVPFRYPWYHRVGREVFETLGAITVTSPVNLRRTPGRSSGQREEAKLFEQRVFARSMSPRREVTGKVMANAQAAMPEGWCVTRVKIDVTSEQDRGVRNPSKGAKRRRNEFFDVLVTLKVVHELGTKLTLHYPGNVKWGFAHAGRTAGAKMLTWALGFYADPWSVTQRHTNTVQRLISGLISELEPLFKGARNHTVGFPDGMTLTGTGVPTDYWFLSFGRSNDPSRWAGDEWYVTSLLSVDPVALSWVPSERWPRIHLDFTSPSLVCVMGHRKCRECPVVTNMDYRRLRLAEFVADNDLEETRKTLEAYESIRSLVGSNWPSGTAARPRRARH